MGQGRRPVKIGERVQVRRPGNVSPVNLIPDNTMSRWLPTVRPTLRTLCALFVLPSIAAAQGRLFERGCGGAPPPPCGPEEKCRTPVQLPCGPALQRVSSDVRVALADRVLRYEVTEIFKNNSGRVAEADYVFPLPTGAAFEDLKLSINGELVSGETMTADRARGIYEEIVRRQRDPALVEWMGSGMLRARIFPINPGEEKKVVVRYQSVAEREGDALRIDYSRGSDPNSSGSGVRPVAFARQADGESGAWTHFSFLYQAGSSYGEPYSPTHALRMRDEGRLRLVEARGSASDLTLLLPLRRANTASLSVLAHAPNSDRGFVLITVTPPSGTHRTTPRDLTFVVDVSGSMAGRKLDQAKAAGRALLESLRPDDRFRIIDFSSDVRNFHDGWSTATDDNVRDGRRYIESLRAEGSTNISGALTEALDLKARQGRLPLVVFVTDGEPTVGERNPEAIAALAARLRGEARVFSVGVSADVNAALIEQLAVEGHGTAHFVRDGESVERAVSLLARRLTAPVLTNVRLKADGVRLTQMLPNDALDVFAGQDLVLLARYDGHGDATLRLEGESADGPVTWTTRAAFPERSRENPFVARLWAAQRIGWLAAEQRKRGGTTELDGEIRSLGETYGIPTEFSSYLVVEPGMSVATGQPMRRDMVLDQVAATGGVAKAGGRSREADRSMPTAPQSSVGASARPLNEVRFEAAKEAAAQREMKSLASLDSASDASASTERQVGTRRFALANGVWTDARYSASMRIVRVKAFSPAYFELVRRLDGLSQPLSQGDRVIVAGRAVAIELSPNGDERLDARVLDQIVRDW